MTEILLSRMHLIGWNRHKPGDCLRALQRGASAQCVDIPLTEGVSALSGGINLTGELVSGLIGGKFSGQVGTITRLAHRYYFQTSGSLNG